jgi:hypothetical protein
LLAKVSFSSVVTADGLQHVHYRPNRDTSFTNHLQPVCGSLLLESHLELILECSVILGAVLIRREAGVSIQIRPPNGLAEPGEQPVVCRTDGNVFVGRVEDIKGCRGWMPVAGPLDRLPVCNGLH